MTIRTVLGVRCQCSSNEIGPLRMLESSTSQPLSAGLGRTSKDRASFAARALGSCPRKPRAPVSLSTLLFSLKTRAQPVRQHCQGMNSQCDTVSQSRCKYTHMCIHCAYIGVWSKVSSPKQVLFGTISPKTALGASAPGGRRSHCGALAILDLRWELQGSVPKSMKR